MPKLVCWSPKSPEYITGYVSIYLYCIGCFCQYCPFAENNLINSHDINVIFQVVLNPTAVLNATKFFSGGFGEREYSVFEVEN